MILRKCSVSFDPFLIRIPNSFSPSPHEESIEVLELVFFLGDPLVLL